MSESTNINTGLVVLLHRCFRAVNKVRQKELSEFGITASQSSIIRTIYRLGNEATASKISEQLFLELNSVSEQLTRMEKEGLIKRKKGSGRRPVTRLEVAEKGHELHLKTMKQESAERIMSVLTEEEKKELWSFLIRIRDQAARELNMESEEYYPPAEPPG